MSTQQTCQNKFRLISSTRFRRGKETLLKNEVIVDVSCRSNGNASFSDKSFDLTFEAVRKKQLDVLDQQMNICNRLISLF